MYAILEAIVSLVAILYVLVVLLGFATDYKVFAPRPTLRFLPMTPSQ